MTTRDWKEIRRQVSVILAIGGGLGALLFWWWMHWAMAEAREEHQHSWPCASFATYPVRDVPLRCLPGETKDGG
jgi:hypothetical protein